ncbi:hypothetical protein [Salinibaculum salinum]|uniref:hypothetical protein n=1 Tax=Salinibaculum salinum TaxID=3131996 RepID=UPI0030EEFAE7
MVEITLLGGLVGGLVATSVMTIFMMALGDDSPPPTALFWSKSVGDEGPESYMMQGMALHMFYGVVAGVILAVALPAVGFGDVTLVTALGIGLAFGFVLFVGAAIFWMNVVLALDPEPKQVGAFLLFHLIYGAVLGGVLGAGVV